MDVAGSVYHIAVAWTTGEASLGASVDIKEWVVILEEEQDERTGTWGQGTGRERGMEHGKEEEAVARRLAFPEGEGQT